jgi:hypothetical protein
MSKLEFGRTMNPKRRQIGENLLTWWRPWKKKAKQKIWTTARFTFYGQLYGGACITQWYLLPSETA